MTSCQMKEMMEGEKKFLTTKWKVEALVLYICMISDTVQIHIIHMYV